MVTNFSVHRKPIYPVRRLAAGVIPLGFLYVLKFWSVGFDPMDSTRKMNLIEQLNQTLTYVASLKAANRENKYQLVVSEETGLLDSNFPTKLSFLKY
jgi:hypothetical protein